MLGDGLAVADGRKFGRPPGSVEPLIDCREDVVVVGFFGLKLREEIEGRGVLVAGCGGGAMLCLRVVD